ncbi:expressed unknown protein [Seminavis robusta]|uniref:Bud22 domain-containing protein n=1 Tax=Seminavis robusta TaxID=568900 RepID=A0A9N8HUM5_9STRA|nr:expressed unknown protein [Seminavis robusta]|eukprot:Sro1403_g269650.1 n/a (374) ;mRNA; r:7266-8387
MTMSSEATPSASKPSSNSKTSNKTKRKQKKQKSELPRWEQEQVQYYERLLHATKKSLRKHTKTVKNFECQKEIRKLKDNKKKETSCSYELLKQLDLEWVVQECVRRLGILHLNPQQPSLLVVEEQKEEEDAPPIPPEAMDLVERLLKHKRLQSTLEEWNEKVTEYRRWSLQKQEQHDTHKFSTTTTMSKKKKQKQKKKAAANQSEELREPTSVDTSLFCTLGAAPAGDVEEDDQDSDDPYQNPYGPGGTLEHQQQQPKKNRKGQRARRAKAMAIEAKQAGRLHRAQDSLNWRAPKQNQDHNNNHNNNDPNSHNQSHHSNNNNQWDSSKVAPNHNHHQQQQPKQKEEPLHPSWAAAKKETSGIVQFKGTKITFD